MATSKNGATTEEKEGSGSGSGSLLRLLTLDDILSEQGSMEERRVLLPAFNNAYITLRAMSAGEFQELGARHARIDDEGNKSLDLVNFYKDALLISVVEPSLTQREVDALWSKTQAAVQPIIAAIDALNAIGPKAQEKLEAAFPRQ